MAKKKEKKGFTPELHELFDTLYEKLREYGQCCAFIAICDNKNEITKRIGIIDEVTHQEEGGVVLPDIAIANAMGGDSPQDIAGRHLVYNAVLSYLHEYPDEIPDFLMNFQEMVKDIREEMDDNDTPEVEIPIVINSNNNPNGDCASRMHLVTPQTVWQVTTEFFIERHVPFHLTFGINPVGEPALIYTVVADGVVTEQQLADLILEVQGYLTSYDVTPIIHLQS